MTQLVERGTEVIEEGGMKTLVQCTNVQSQSDY